MFSRLTVKEGPKPYFGAQNIISNFKYLWLLNGCICNNIKKTDLIVHSSGKTPSAIKFHALNVQFIILKMSVTLSVTIRVCDDHCSRDHILYILPFKGYAKDSVKVPLFYTKQQICLSLCLKCLRNL